MFERVPIHLNTRNFLVCDHWMTRGDDVTLDVLDTSYIDIFGVKIWFT